MPKPHLGTQLPKHLIWLLRIQPLGPVLSPRAWPLCQPGHLQGSVGSAPGCGLRNQGDIRADFCQGRPGPTFRGEHSSTPEDPV